MAPHSIILGTIEGISRQDYERMKKEEIRFEAYNTQTDYEVLIVSFGTMSRVCKTAIDRLKEDNGLAVGMIRPQTLFPFPEEAVFNAASKAGCGAVASIEMSMGQMVEDVERSIKGVAPVHWYGKCGGDVPTPEEIIDFIRSIADKSASAA